MQKLRGCDALLAGDHRAKQDEANGRRRLRGPHPCLSRAKRAPPGFARATLELRREHRRLGSVVRGDVLDVPGLKCRCEARHDRVLARA